MGIRKDFSQKGRKILAQVALRGCGISVLGGVQSPTALSNLIQLDLF